MSDDPAEPGRSALRSEKYWEMPENLSSVVISFWRRGKPQPEAIRSCSDIVPMSAPDHCDVLGTKF